jgi:hypothetical protein
VELIPTEEDVKEITVLSSLVSNKIADNLRQKREAQLTIEDRVHIAAETLDELMGCGWETIQINDKTGLQLEARVAIVEIDTDLEDETSESDTEKNDAKKEKVSDMIQLETRFVNQAGVASTEKPVLTLTYDSENVNPLYLQTHPVHGLHPNVIDIRSLRDMDLQSYRQILDIQSEILDPLYKIVFPEK